MLINVIGICPSFKAYKGPQAILGRPITLTYSNYILYCFLARLVHQTDIQLIPTLAATTPSH